MKVRATRTGYIYHIRRREDDVFTLIPVVSQKTGKTIAPEQQFSEKWMERVDAKMPESTSTSQAEINRKHDLELAERAASKVPASKAGSGDDVI